MRFSRRQVIGLVAAGGLAGCLGDGQRDDGDDSSEDAEDSSGPAPTEAANGDRLLGDDSGTSDGTSPAGSCASNFGDTMQRYDASGRELLATFSYPTGGEITFQDDTSTNHVTSFAYGRGDISPLHSLVVSETGPLGDTGDATEAYAFNDNYESGTVTTYGGQTRPAAILRTGDSSVIYLVRVDGPDGFYEFSVQTAVGVGEECPETYESVTRAVVESFEPR